MFAKSCHSAPPSDMCLGAPSLLFAVVLLSGHTVSWQRLGTYDKLLYLRFRMRCSLASFMFEGLVWCAAWLGQLRTAVPVRSL